MLTSSPARVEVERVQELHSLRILDTPPEQDFDNLLELASRCCGVPRGAITLIDDHRVFHKAAIGASPSDVPRAASFCNNTILQDDVMVVEDVLHDERFRDNKVARAAAVRFYAGAPLTMPSGARLGALCVFSDRPGQLSGEQRASLRNVALQVVTLLRWRADRLRAERLSEKLAAQQHLFEVYFHNTPVQSCLKDEEGRIVLYNNAFAQRFNITLSSWLGKRAEDLWPADVAREVAALEHQAQVTKLPVTRYLSIPEGLTSTHWRSTRVHCVDADGRSMRLSISVEVTKELEDKRHLERSAALIQKLNGQLGQALAEANQRSEAKAASALPNAVHLRTVGRVEATPDNLSHLTF